MPVFNVSYSINDTVFHVGLEFGVREGIVRSSTVKTTVLGTTIKYDVQFKVASNGSVEAVEEDLFADIDTALAEYKVRVQCQIQGC